MKNIAWSVAFAGICHVSYAQTTLDSIVLKEVTVSAYLSERPLLRLPSSAYLIDSVMTRSSDRRSFLPAANGVAGVRMEERSPGSYRLSIRGSLLRSPFGIRNIKVYLDEFPLTDAGGNTYFNLLESGFLDQVEVLKGPDGSLFGANSGGVIRVHAFPSREDSSHADMSISLGSFGSVHEYAAVHLVSGRNRISFGEGLLKAQGYRRQSRIDRKHVQLRDAFHYGRDSEIRLVVFYSDLDYETPGGLTRAQWVADPRSARLSTAILPSAEEQDARVRNKTIYAGVLNEARIGPGWRLMTAFFGSKTDFENPFITNFETREETNAGVRSWLQKSSNEGRNVRWKVSAGGEIQRIDSRITHFGNHGGERDSLQDKSRLQAGQTFGFVAGTVDFFRRFCIDASLSYNFNGFVFEDLLSNMGIDRNVFEPQLMPRIGLSYGLTPVWALRFIVAKGYSAPTLAEVLSSGNVLNENLQPESGTNYEAGFRFRSTDSRWFWDASVFYYKLGNAIVRRTDESGQEFFINAGGVSQPGFESQLQFDLIRDSYSSFIRTLTLTSAYTFSYFRFVHYSVESNDYSGNLLTGVPKHTAVTGLGAALSRGISISTRLNYTSAIPLDDANTAFSEEYYLLQARLGWKYQGNRRFGLELYLSFDNILNENYSLGNDLNAAGGRYYNPAPPLNFSAGIIFTHR